MLFNSLQYILFLPLVLAVYWLTPARFRAIVLLAASYIFYGSWNPVYLLLIVGMTVANWLFGFAIASSVATKKAWLAFALIFNIGLLGYFKYTNFFLKLGFQALNLLNIPHPEFMVNVILPLGISFFTFEFLHYVIEVYKGQEPVRNFGEFAVFAGFFPTQIAGPIKRYQEFIPQIRNGGKFDRHQYDAGFVLVLHGLAKKILLADNLAIFVNAVYKNPGYFSEVELWLATYAFAYQVYCDFSGYTDIAIGSSAMLGLSVPPNFNVPYMSNNIRELWHRQHISLSLWFRDYVYFSLGGSRCAEWKVYRNLLLTTCLAGLWHGAALHYIAWGMFQGLSLIVHRIWMQLYNKIEWLGKIVKTKVWNVVAIFITFHAFCISFVFFRADHIPIALNMVARMLNPAKLFAPAPLSIFTSQGPLVMPLIPFLLIGLFAAQVISEFARKGNFFGRAPRLLKAAYCTFLIFLMLALLPDESNRFLYFQF